MNLAHLQLHATMALRALLRRRLALLVLLLFPLVLYGAAYDALGRSVRALVFGISWAMSTVAFFATISAREIDPRLLEDRHHDASLLLDQFQKNMHALQLGVSRFGCQALCSLESLLKFDCKFVESHASLLAIRGP